MKPFITGINHLGLVVEDIEKAKSWFRETLGMQILEDRGELVFLQCGDDILAIKTPRMAVAKPEHGEERDPEIRREGWQSLDHYGFFAESAEQVDQFAVHIEARGAKILKGPYDRRDGRSVYFKDPMGNVGEYLFYDPRYQVK